MEYSYLLKLADECEDPHMKLAYAGKISISFETLAGSF